MIQLTAANIRLAARPGNKEEAIRLAGSVLVNSGYIAPGYIDSMLGREQQANTYLDHGIAIPHGLARDRDLIRKTGVCVVQVPEGVPWNEGQRVHLVIGLAAKSEEHLGILAALTDVLDDPAKAAQLVRTSSADEIITALTRIVCGSNGERASAASPEGHFVDVMIGGSAGLHARPAAFFVEAASAFPGRISVQYGGKTANGKAISSLLKLGVPGGALVRISASGPDAEPALAALQAAVAGGLGEEDEALWLAPTARWKPEGPTRFLTGVAAAPGLALGPLCHFNTTHVVVRDVPPENLEDERRVFADALETARQQLGEVYESVRARSGRSEAMIFRAHQALLSDPDLVAEVYDAMDQNHSSAWSWQTAIAARVLELRAAGTERLAGRAGDLHDVGQRVLHLLASAETHELNLPDEPVILLAEDLTPSDTAKLDPRRILGLATAAGGPTSHTAIIARSLGIPAIVGAGPALLELAEGGIVILDGATGRLYVEPRAEDLASARAFQNDLAGDRRAEHESRYEPALTTDGHRVEVVANINQAIEAQTAVNAGAEGVGLLRTEFLFLDRAAAPSEDEQFAAYSTMTRALNGLPLIVRTLDIGGDKTVPYLALPKEENPFLGVRGLRLCLRQPELFEAQLRAIYRAARTGFVRIMFPMIATLEDLRAAKAAAEKVRQALDAPVVEIGIMIEVPSAVMLAPELAREVDFFSIGTNDLTQYVLAMDRLNPALARQIDGLHPAVLRMIELTVRAAAAEGKWVGVCGGIAGDPAGAIILTGLGVQELSVSVPAVAATKARLRGISLSRAKKIAQQALACTTAAEVHQLPLS